jgi:spore maturation protein CgeB
MLKNGIKVLLVGESHEYGRINFYAKAFEKLSCKVYVLNTALYYKVQIINRIINHFIKVPIYFGTGGLASAILKKTLEVNPHFVLFFKPVFILEKTILGIKQHDIPIYSWFPDDVLYCKNSSRNFHHSVALYGCHFSTKSFNIQDFLKMGAKKAVFLPHAVDTSYHHPVEVSAEEKNKLGADIVFVGTYVKEERYDYLEKLCKEGYNIKVYGTCWDRCPRSSCLRRSQSIQFKGMYGTDLSRVLNSSRIALAFLRKHNRDKHTARTYEIPACGAFMLHERTEEAKVIFQEGKEADYFNSFQELKEKIDYYLNHQAEAKEIASAGYRRVIKPDCSYEDRAQKILDVYSKEKCADL